jgi:pimeloyl-ACP methyl ester carboxylesterase
MPVKPYPYREVPITFENAVAHVQLSGTLTLPQGPGPFPAVVLIAGSGPQTRDENIFGHAFFLVLADHLTRDGIAVLRYDKRGLGQSTGDYAAATSSDFAADADAGVEQLKKQPEIDPKRIGLIGHSEGSIIAPMVAEKDPAIAFLVLMAVSGVPGDQIIMAQTRAISAAAGASEAELAARAAIERRYLDAVMSAEDKNSAKLAVREVLKGVGMPNAAIDAQAKLAASDWYRFFLRYDPAPALRGLRLPVLAIIGSKDLQVPAEQNLPALREALKSDHEAQVIELADLNHLFQTAKTGVPSEYSEIEETVSPGALDLITRWILQRT